MIFDSLKAPNSLPELDIAPPSLDAEGGSGFDERLNGVLSPLKPSSKQVSSPVSLNHRCSAYSHDKLVEEE